MPAVPSCLLEPIWVEFHALLNEARGGEPPRFDPSHPWGCHRERIPDRVVFEHVIDALVHGSGYERIASAGCSDPAIRRRVTQWARLGLAERLHAVTLAAYDLIIGLGADGPQRRWVHGQGAVRWGEGRPVPGRPA